MMVIAITIAAIIQPAAIHRPPTSPVCFYLVQQTMALTLDSVSAPRSGRLDRLLQTRRPSDYRAPHLCGIWEFNRLGGEDLLSAAMIVGEPNPWWEEFTTACRSC